LSTPNAAIYSEIENALFIQKLQTIIILTAAASVTSALIFFILRRNAALERRIEERTSELRTANEELRNHDKMQKEFINIAAHELRTPIVPILNLSELLYSNVLLYRNAKEQQQQERGQEEEQQKEMLEMLKIILRNANRLHQLTEDILDATRIESHTLKLRKERFNLNDAILNVVEDYKEQIANDNVKVMYEPGNSITLVEADRRRLTQVISNLLSNALKFTKEGTVTVSTAIERKDEGDGREGGAGGEEEVVVSVKDTGTGIDHELMPRLFTKFATKSYQGTGLGLFISKSIVEAHGGRMWAENNNNDRKHKGATFYFTLPVVDMNERTREEEQEKKQEARLVNDQQLQ
jgi:signal transduction histidine kinase